MFLALVHDAALACDTLSCGAWFMLLIAVFSGAALLLWRLFKFTLVPLLYPNEPKELPYWIPFVGHMISFLGDQDGLFRCGRSYFGKDREPFAMCLAGARIYVLTSAHDIAAVYRNTTTLSFEDGVKDTMRIFGLTEDGSEKIWRRDYQGVYPNPSKKPFAALSWDLNKVQLHPGKNLDNLTDKFMEFIDGFMHWDSLPLDAVLEKSAYSKKMSLMKLCQGVLVDAGSQAIFGRRLTDISTDLAKHFHTFDQKSWQLIYQLPPRFAKEMHAAKEEVTRALVQYIESPAETKKDKAWLIGAMEAEMKALDMKIEDKAIMLFMVYWLANVNAYKSSFWLLSYVLTQPLLSSSLQAETAPAVNGSRVDLTYLNMHCPLLNAVFDETVRLTNSASSVRNVTLDTVINDRLYRAGSKIMMPYRQLHFNEAVFGPNSEEFDPSRFLNNKDLSRSPSYKPFGGGSTLCSGRFIAKYEVIAFVAMLINRFDLRLADEESGLKQTFPRFNRTKPGLGIMEPKDGDDLVINVAQRTI